jgi:outer membrane immunogenic protein
MATKMLPPAFAAVMILLGGAVEAQSCSGGGRFDGPYIGANLGLGSNHTGQSSPGEPDVAGGDYSAIAGGQIGFNRQCGQFVLGIEADFNFAGFVTNTAWPDPIFLKDEVNWFGTLRGRLGLVVNDTAMLYVTGGLVYASITHTLFDPVFLFRQSDDDFKLGWTAGIGLEVLHYDRWLLRAEGMFVDPGANAHVYTFAGCGGVCTGRARWDDSFLVARLGLSYRFTRDPPPLK